MKKTYINKTPVRLINKEADSSKKRHKLYNLAVWRKLRKSFLMLHPICMLCGKELASDIHHKISPFTGDILPQNQMQVFLDETNLLALCKKCHGQIHRQEQIKGKKNSDKV